IRIRRAGFDRRDAVRPQDRRTEEAFPSALREELLLRIRFAELDVGAVLLPLQGNERDLSPSAVSADFRAAGTDRRGGVDLPDTTLDGRLIVVDRHLEAVEYVEHEAQGLGRGSLGLETGIAGFEHADQVAILPASAGSGIEPPGARDLLLA